MEMRPNTFCLLAILCCLFLIAASAAQKADSGHSKPNSVAVQRGDDNLAAVELEGKWGYIDPTGKYVINPQFDRAEYFSERLARVEFGSKAGFVDKSGKYVINPQFDGALNFAAGMAPVRMGDRWGYIDKGGKYVIDPQFDFAFCFADGLAVVEFGGRLVT
jgi:hypothetical protein